MKKLFILLSITILLSSCATLFTTSYQTVKINSVPADADVYLNLKNVGKTCTTLAVKRSSLTDLVTIKKEGYKDYQFEFDLQVNPAYWANLPFCIIPYGLIGAYWDVSEGNYLKTKEEYNITLEKK